MFINYPDHMTMAMQGKNPLKFFFSGTDEPIAMKLDM